jgi:hypothetical protein
MKDAIEIEDDVDILFKKCNLTVEDFHIHIASVNCP